MKGNPDSLKRSVHYWVKALSRVGQGVSELRVPANTMIELTDDFFEDTSPSQNTEWFQIDGERFEVYLDDDTFVNAELIKFIEETPDTVITLRDNEKILVKEGADEVIGRVIEYARSLRWIPGR